MRFSETFRIKILEERGEVRVSVRTNDDRIDEFYICIEDFSDVILRNLSTVKYSNDSLWLKGIEKIGLGIKTGGCQWCIYIFSPHHWAILRESYISQLREKNINSIAIIGKGDDPSSLNSICNFDLTSTIDTLHMRIEVLEQAVNSLVGNQSLVLSQLSQLSLPKQPMVAPPSDAIPPEEEFEDFTTETFIPTVEATEHSNISTEESSEENDLVATAKKLKQIKKRKK